MKKSYCFISSFKQPLVGVLPYNVVFGVVNTSSGETAKKKNTFSGGDMNHYSMMHYLDSYPLVDVHK